MLRSAVVPLCLVLAAIPVAARAAAALPQQQVDRIYAQSNQATPGCAVGIAQRGKPVLMRAYGMADLEHGVRNSADTIFEAGSDNADAGAAAAALARLYLAPAADAAAEVALMRPASMPPLFAPERSAGPAQAGAGELAELAGTCRRAEADAFYIVAVENGQLVARGRSGEALPLSGEAADRFRAGPVRVLFRRNAPGKVEGLSVAADRVWDIRFERQQ